MNFLTMTNTTKAHVIVAINAIMIVVTSFGVTLTDKQQGAIQLAVNADLSLWVALTYQNSPKRKP